jgi:hypothetical protein
VGSADVVAAVLKAAPGRTAVVGGGERAEVPNFSAATGELAEAVNSLRHAASQPAWWRVNDRVSLPTDDLNSIAEKVAKTGYASPEQLREVLAAADTVAASGMTAASPGAAGTAVAAARRERKALWATLGNTTGEVAADDSGELRRLEAACLPYINSLETGNSAAAASVEAVAAKVGAYLRGGY